MSKTTVKLISEMMPCNFIDGVEFIDLKSLNNAQKNYFKLAWKAFLDNLSCWEFDKQFYFDSSSQFYSLVSERGEAMISHPLYRALQALWLALGVNQGQMAGEKYITLYIII